MKITAKEMFEALGYKLYEDDIAIVFENNQGDVIAFTYKDKELVVQPKNISKSISMAELKSINMQIKELGWIKPEVKPDETNFEHYFEYLSKRRMSDFALIDGRVTQCMDTRCSKCDFNGDCNNDCKLSDRRILRELKDKGYFKGVDENATIEDILENCEVIKDVNG